MVSPPHPTLLTSSSFPTERTHELHFGTFQFRETNSHIRVVRLQSLGKEGSKKGGGGGIPWAFRRHAFENARDLQYFKSH